MSTRKLTNDQLKKFRSNVAFLKSKGLVSKKIDARKQAPTDYMQRQVRKFSDVIEGKAKVVHTPKAKDAKPFKEAFRVKGKSVVVPVTNKSEKLVYAKKTKIISATRTTKQGKKITREIYAEGISKSKPPKDREGIHYVIPLGNSRQSFDTWEDLVLFMNPYETNTKNPYKDWEQFVELVRVDEDDEE